MSIKKLERTNKQKYEAITDEEQKQAVLLVNAQVIENAKKDLNDKKIRGLTEIKNKFNIMCQKVNVNANEFVNLIQ